MSMCMYVCMYVLRYVLTTYEMTAGAGDTSPVVCLCMYVCMYVCIEVCTYYVWDDCRSWRYVPYGMSMCMYVCMYVCMYWGLYISVLYLLHMRWLQELEMCPLWYVCLYVFVHTYIYIYIYIYAYICVCVYWQQHFGPGLRICTYTHSPHNRNLNAQIFHIILPEICTQSFAETTVRNMYAHIHTHIHTYIQVGGAATTSASRIPSLNERLFEPCMHTYIHTYIHTFRWAVQRPQVHHGYPVSMNGFSNEKE